MPGKQRLTHTPFLDAWRLRLAAATDGRGAKTDLAQFLVTQGRRELQACQNLVSNTLAGKLVPNAEDLLAMDHWLALRTASTPKRGSRQISNLKSRSAATTTKPGRPGPKT